MDMLPSAARRVLDSAYTELESIAKRLGPAYISVGGQTSPRAILIHVQLLMAPVYERWWHSSLSHPTI